MRNIKTIFAVLLLIAALALAGCDTGDTDTAVTVPDQAGDTAVVEDEDATVFEEEATPVVDTTGEGMAEEGMTDEATPEEDAAAEQAAPAMQAADIDSFLEQVNNDEIPNLSDADGLPYGFGYLLYYGPVDTLGVDNLIYNALLVRNQLETGELTEADLNAQQQNLLTLTEEVEFDPNVEPTEQIQQTPEIRQAIMEHFVESQAEMSAADAMAADQYIGVYAPPAPDQVGAEYMVYTQDNPDAPFEFLGTIIAVDATNREPQAEPTYSFQGWNELPWLGDAAGAFWDDIPAGVSGDMSATDEGRPGVLLISADMFEQIEAGDFGS